MPELVISDTSCLIILDKINEFEILHSLYDSVITTPEVANEYIKELPDWILIQKAENRKYQQLLETLVDKGEASTIALAAEHSNALLLLDDRKARLLARKLRLPFTGVLGILQKAKQAGIIEKMKPVVEKLLLTDFRVSQKIIDELLRRNNE